MSFDFQYISRRRTPPFLLSAEYFSSVIDTRDKDKDLPSLIMLRSRKIDFEHLLKDLSAFHQRRLIKPLFDLNANQEL